MTDRELAQQVIKGNHNAFAEIVHRYSGMVFSKAIGVMHSEDGAAEVTQQTFVRAYENIDVWRGTELGPWLTAIVTHTALKLLDKERRRRTVSLDALQPRIRDTSSGDADTASSGPVLGDSLADTSYSDEHEARLQQMEAAVAALPKADQQLLRLHYYDQLKTADIARRTGLSQSNVLVKLHRIRERLRERLIGGDVR